MWMYSWLSNTYSDVCLYEKDTFLIWFWCMGHKKTTTVLKSHLNFCSLYIFVITFSSFILWKIEIFKNISWNSRFGKINCDATLTRIWPPALHRPSFFVQYPSLLKCDFLFVWNEIDLLPVLLGAVHKSRRIFSCFFDPFPYRNIL